MAARGGEKVGSPSRNNGEVLTTGEVAALLHVAPRSVAKWFDAGRIGGYLHPGLGGALSGRHRRFPRADVERFARANGFPLPGRAGVALAGVPDALALSLPDAVRVATLYDLCLHAADCPAGAALVLDASLGRGECLSAGRSLRSRLPFARLVYLVGADGCVAAEFRAAGYDAVLPWPATAETLTDSLDAPAAGREECDRG